MTTTLPAFLAQIGAAALAPTIVAPPAGSKGHLATLSDRIQAEIDSVNDQTRELLASEWPEFRVQVQSGQELLARMGAEERDLAELEKVMSSESTALLEQLAAHAALATSHAHSEHVRTALVALLDLHTFISTLASSTTRGALPTSVAALHDVQTCLATPPPQWVVQLDHWSALLRWAKDEEARLEGALVGAFEGCFEFTGLGEGSSGGETRLVMRESIAAAPHAEEITTSVILSSLEDVLASTGGGTKKFEHHLARIASRLLKYFITPFLASNGGPTGTRLEWVYDDSNGVHTVLLRSATTDAAQDPLQVLERFLAFFSRHSPFLPSSTYAATFTQHLTPSLQSLLISHHLAPSLPPTTSLLPPYLTLLAKASTFESSFLTQNGFFAFLSSTQEEARVIQDWAARVDRHWSKHVGTIALQRVREEIMRNDWEGERVEIEIEEEEYVPLPPPEVVKEVVIAPPSPPVRVVEVVVPVTPTKKGRQALGTRIVSANVSPIVVKSSPPPPPPPIVADDEPEGEEDAWGLDLEPDVSSLPPPPVPFPSDEPEARLRKASTTSTVSSTGEDAWGFGGEEIVEEEVGGVEGEGGDDGWGFAEEVLGPIKEAMPSGEEVEVDEWEFDLGEVVPEPALSSPVAPATPVKSVPTPTARHIKKESVAGWGWEDELALPPPSPSKSSPPKSPRSRVGTGNAGNGLAKLTGIGEESRGVERRTRKEFMMVSKRSRVITGIAEELLREAFAIHSLSLTNKDDYDFAAATPTLLKSFTSILSLYRSTITVQHGHLLTTVPAIGMQISNDALWIGSETLRSWSRVAGPIRPDVEIESAVEMMRREGQRERERQVGIQRKGLMEILDESKGFLYTGKDDRFAACERAMRQVTYTLERLAKVWKPVMNPTALYTTLGSLVNEVLTRVLEEIEDQSDISEEESIRLNKLCKILHGLEALFDGGISSVGHEVHIWFKFVFLSELLEASMADILFLFDNGHLVDFSTHEIAKLVRALFSESALRRANVEHIMNGHPEVVASGSDDGI